MGRSSWTSPLVFLAGVAMGTGSTITVKVMYGLKSVGITGEPQFFEKPLFTTLIMFIAMSCALPVHFLVAAVQRRQRRKQRGAEYQPLNGSLAQVDDGADAEAIDEDLSVPWRTYFLLAIPSTFDLLGTALASIGLLFTTVSVYQLVRCSVIIVCALLKGTVLGLHLSKTQWVGIGVNTLAMILVSLTSWIPGQNAGATAEAEDGIDRDPRLGIAFILASCFVQGAQYVFEERVMTVEGAPPLIVVGMEGVWGTLLMMAVVFPWAYLLPGTDVGGCVENIEDSLMMLSNSRSIQLVLLAFTLTVCAYNIFCIYVTYLLSSIWHAILDNFRPIAVWMTDLALYYWITHRVFGERWTSASWLELLGMLLLLVGTAIYNGTIRLPGFAYDEDKDTEKQYEDIESDDNHRVLMKSSTETLAFDISSPMFTRSPLVTRAMGRSPHGIAHSSHGHGGSYGATRDLSDHFGPPSLSLNGPLSRSHEDRLSHSYTDRSSTLLQSPASGHGFVPQSSSRTTHQSKTKHDESKIVV